MIIQVTVFGSLHPDDETILLTGATHVSRDVLESKSVPAYVGSLLAALRFRLPQLPQISLNIFFAIFAPLR
jgi:hypothetical protein